jgi:ADP-ribose pyrophosphatase YjhB (NUDIX family)
MDTIALIDQHELGLYDPADKDPSYIRYAVRGVIMDGDGRVALVHFPSIRSYKLPGGPMSDGEDVRPALQREVREEIGYNIANIRGIGITEENRNFSGMHQTSYCFIADANGYVGRSLTEDQATQNMELVWVGSLNAAISAIDGASEVDEDGSEIGLCMMKSRDIAILRAAKTQLGK